MYRSPSGWLPTLVLLAALIGAAGAEAGPIRGIYRPSAFGQAGLHSGVLPAGVPRFDAIALHADDPEHAESLAGRLGFVVTRTGGRAWRVSVALGGNGGGMVWRDARHDPAFGARGLVAPLPLQTVSFLPPDPELPLAAGRASETRAPAHPNAITGVAYMIGLVRHIDATAGHWPPERTRESGGGVPLLDFRARYPVPALGARACDAPAAAFGGSVRLLEPDGADGFARERLERAGAGWLGFGLATADVERTAAWFDTHGVRYRRDAVAGRLTLRLDPAETDGWLVEVVGPPALPAP